MSTCDVTCVEPSLLGSATRPTLRNAQLRSAAPNGTVSSAASPSPVLAHGLAARTRESTRPRSVASPLVAGLRTASCCQRQSPPVAKITCGAALRMRTTAGKLTMTRVRMRDLRREFIEGSLCLLGVDGLPTTRIALARQNLCALLQRQDRLRNARLETVSTVGNESTGRRLVCCSSACSGLFRDAPVNWAVEMPADDGEAIADSLLDPVMFDLASRSSNGCETGDSGIERCHLAQE